MELRTLNLNTALAWSRDQAEAAGIGTASAAVDAVERAPEGAELALAWKWDTVVDSEGDEGPCVRRPLTVHDRIAASGIAAPAATHRAVSGPARENDSGGTQAVPASAASTMRLETGRYLFVQTRVPPAAQGEPGLDAWLADSIEWFAREAWWTGTVTSGPLVVRLVREDGKTAVQIIRQTQ